MRGYECYYYKKVGDNYLKNDNVSCWAGMRIWTGNTLYSNRSTEEAIYIDVNCTDYNKKLLEILLPIINEITPCYSIELPELGSNIIYYKVIYKDIKNYTDSHYRNMFLLNFIRYVWNWNAQINPDKTKSFEYLLEKYRPTIKDPIELLTTANKEAYILNKYGYDIDGDHSNLFKSAKIKTLEKFNKHTFDSIQGFLTTK